jgi:hypothetical protein
MKWINRVENVDQRCGSYADWVRTCRIHIKSLILPSVLGVEAHRKLGLIAGLVAGRNYTHPVTVTFAGDLQSP